MKKLIVLIMFISGFTFSQNKSIKLPKGSGLKFNYSDKFITPILNIYVSKNGNISFLNTHIPIEKLGDSIYKYRNKQPVELLLSLQNHIYADKKTPYKYIDAVKKELNRAVSFNIFYRTGNTLDITKGIMTFLEKYSLTKIKEPIKAAEDVIFVDFPIVLDPVNKIQEDLYNLKFDEVKKSLLKAKYCKIKIFNKNKILINNKKISLKNEAEIYDAMKDNDFFFLFTEKNICYQDYIRNLSILRKSHKKYEKKISIIDISLELEKILKEKKIKL